MATDTERAIAALLNYGYEFNGAGYSYKGTTWQETDGGFLRFQKNDGAWSPVPYSIAPEWEGVGGLTYTDRPQCFAMVYPADYLVHIYETAATI